ncbi:MAG: HK97 gp10 family phage protein [Dehalococcoidales bacterium]|nr:HK97 gp10 family phage protein [Dehalococcoidales bacterium]
MTDVRMISYKAERLAEINARLKSNMTKACLLVERDAKINAPVDTGRLRASITNRLEVEKDQLIGIVGTNVEYAPYQEFGTSKMPAHPFLYPALEANKSKIKGLLKEK